MKFIFIIEDEDRTQKDLFETLKSIDPSLAIRFFTDLSQFHEWLKLAVQEGPKALAQGGIQHELDKDPPLEPAATHELRLVIAKNEFLGTQNMGLIRRAREFFLRKKMCSAEEPTALILTAFDSPDFDIKLAEERIINNVIFKPFDKLILKQHIEFALTGHHPMSEATVAAMKINSTIEMLKEVSMCRIGELGFTTINNHEIKLGAITKYYSSVFEGGNKRSVFAYCASCKELSEKEFECEFHFFGIDNQQLGQIRRHVLQNKEHKNTGLQNTHGHHARILVINDVMSEALDLKNYFTDKIANAEVYAYSSFGQLMSDIADKDSAHRQQLPVAFDFVFSGYEIFEEEKEKRWQLICDGLKDRVAKSSGNPSPPPGGGSGVSAIGSSGGDNFENPHLFLLTKKKIAFDEMRAFSTWTKDIFFLPLDRSYFLKKILASYSGLLNKEPVTIASLDEQNTLKVANPVEITQISEAGLIMKYYRAISVGAFREFILWRPEETQTPEVIGTVNFSEEDPSNKESFLNHIVFFGMRDHYLKHIRLWLREAYIKQKEKEAG